MASNMGRPTIEIDFKKVDALCSVFCTCQEIVALLNTFDENCSYDTVERRIKEKFNVTFAEYVKQKQNAFGKPKLRKAQWDLGMEGNSTMLIWLGKQYLDQRDKPADEEQSADLSAVYKAIADKLLNGNQ